MTEYSTRQRVNHLPRLPLEGSIDPTYRCNNNCRHCWLWIPPNSPEKEKELTFEEIRHIVDEARGMGCRKWFISGGEPMLRPDFPEIFDYITRNSVSYTLNTNGTLITPEIAQLMKRKGSKLVALYGATAEVHDHITQNPGSFEAVMQGMARLKESGVGFTVQIVPMRDNYHQYREMVQLAESLSPSWRIGASWLWLSACGDPKKNREIKAQRLNPADVIDLDKPDLPYEEWMEEEIVQASCSRDGSEKLFASCIAGRRDFHLDPHGRMSFCCFVKDPDLRYDLKKGSFTDCWERFIPSLAEEISAGIKYKKNCGSCDLRKDCRWCAVYSYLEHRDYSTKVEYLCAVAKENKKSKLNWEKNHRRYYQIAGITIQVDSDLPFTNSTFHSKFKQFQVSSPGKDKVSIRHHFSIPHLDRQDLGKEVYRKPPWAIYKKNNSWIYLGISSIPGDPNIHRVVVFNQDHSRGRIYNRNQELFCNGNLDSLTLFSSDQILLARILAERQGCYLHSSGIILNNKGLLFAGHSEAGKSTMVKMLRGQSEVLCDDRMIVRKWPEGFKIHGTWSHGEVPDISAKSSPLHAIFFLKKHRENRLTQIEDKTQKIKRLLPFLIRAHVSADWWDKMLTLVEDIAEEIPFYDLYFEKNGNVYEVLQNL